MFAQACLSRYLGYSYLRSRDIKLKQCRFNVVKTMNQHWNDVILTLYAGWAPYELSYSKLPRKHVMLKQGPLKVVKTLAQYWSDVVLTLCARNAPSELRRLLDDAEFHTKVQSTLVISTFTYLE